MPRKLYLREQTAGQMWPGATACLSLPYREKSRHFKHSVPIYVNIRNPCNCISVGIEIFLLMATKEDCESHLSILIHLHILSANSHYLISYV